MTLGHREEASPVKDVAAAGGWNDVTTLLKSYRQADERTLRAVMEYQVRSLELLAHEGESLGRGRYALWLCCDAAPALTLPRGTH